MNKRTLFLVLLTGLAALSTVGEPANDSQVLQDLQHKMASVKSIYLEFTQERVLKLFAEPLKSEGGDGPGEYHINDDFMRPDFRVELRQETAEFLRRKVREQAA